MSGRRPRSADASSAARAALLAAAFATSLLAASCSYFTDDPYPDSDQRLLVRTDFDAIAREASGGSKLQEFGAFSYLESGSTSALFVGLRMKNGTNLFLSLDGEKLDEPIAYPTLAADTAVSYATSGVYIASDWLIAPSRAPLYSQAFTASRNFFTEGNRNYNLWLSGMVSLNIEIYDSSYGPPLGTSSILVSTAGNWNLVSSIQADGWYSFLFQDTSTSNYRAFRIQSIQTLYDMAFVPATWGSLFDDPFVPASCKGPLFQADFSSAWLTVDGAVTRSYVDKGVEFTLKTFSGSDKSYTTSNEGENIYYFEPTGKYWFVYEKTTGRLSKLRTWW